MLFTTVCAWYKEWENKTSVTHLDSVLELHLIKSYFITLNVNNNMYTDNHQ